MNNKKYKELALKTDLTKEQYLNFKLKGLKMKLAHAALGLSGEVGELTDMIKKVIMYDINYNVEDLEQECGDVLWYMAVLLDALDSSFDKVMKMNIDKLKRRYPNGFSKKDAIKRKDKK